MYQFTADCMIGIAQIDEEHRELFRMINEAERAVLLEAFDVESVKSLVEALQDYAKNHFAHEEAYMEETEDPELPRQRKEHAVFSEKMDGMYLNLQNLEEKEVKSALLELIEYLARWLYRHILGSDIMIGKLHIKQQGDEEFAFTDEYKTGIPFADKQHERLFEIIRKTNEVIHNEYIPDKYDQIMQVLSELKEYTEMHFSDEEAYMERIHYEGLPSQRLAHEVFVDKLAAIYMEDLDENQESSLEELITFLLGWLKNHIMMSDKLIPVVEMSL